MHLIYAGKRSIIKQKCCVAGQSSGATRKQVQHMYKQLSVLQDMTENFMHRIGPEQLLKDLPAKHEHVVLMCLDAAQQRMYQAYLDVSAPTLCISACLSACWSVCLPCSVLLWLVESHHHSNFTGLSACLPLCCFGYLKLLIIATYPRSVTLFWLLSLDSMLAWTCHLPHLL